VTIEGCGVQGRMSIVGCGVDVSAAIDRTTLRKQLEPLAIDGEKFYSAEL